MKLGKLPARKGAIKLRFANYATSTLPTPPASLKLFTEVSDWQGMLGNDKYGDCVWAGGDHEHIFGNDVEGKAVQFTAQNALSDYSAVTDFNPNDPNSDQGTDMQKAAAYRQKVGLVDAHGNRHKVAAYVAIAPGNVAEVKTALNLFNAVGIGFQFPNYAMDEFNAGQTWHVKTGGSIDGGHYVPAVGYDSRYVYVVTWGKLQRMTWGFFKKYCDEAVVYINPEFFDANGKTVEGFNLTQLQADLKQL